MEVIKLEDLNYKFQLHYETRYTKIFSESECKVILIQVVNHFIPIDEFKKIFNNSTEIIKSEKLNKVVFDKRKMNVFHQPSMEWYFIEWKAELAEKYQVVTHRKILPEDNLFIQSVKIARKKLDETYPDAKYKKLDIQYMESLEEAIKN